MQELNGTEVLPQQQDLRQNEQHVHQKSELSQRDGKAEAQHIGQAGNRGGPQRGLGNQGYAEDVYKRQVLVGLMALETLLGSVRKCG